MLNKPAPTWAEFFGQRRVLPYLKLARDNGRIGDDDAQRVEGVVARLAQLVPEEQPARLHGDLWNGNVLWGTEQRVWVIDPAAHGGHRETDLAMLALFGLPHLPRVLDAYDEATPLADGWQDRAGVHQLYPLLVHACLFGGGYGVRAGATAARYL
jgi:fructosamine-3-kinase